MDAEIIVGDMDVCIIEEYELCGCEAETKKYATENGGWESHIDYLSFFWFLSVAGLLFLLTYGNDMCELERKKHAFMYVYVVHM